MKPIGSWSGRFSFSALLILSCTFLAFPCWVYSQTNDTNCHSNLTSIYLTEKNLRPEDLELERKYILCPNTIFTPGPLDDDYNLDDESPPLFVRSKAVVQCGEDGSSLNNCVIDGGKNGAFGITVAPWTFSFTETFAVGVIFQGITVDYFKATPETPYPVYVEIEYGDVTFVDCVFSNNSGEPIFSIIHLLLPTNDNESKRPHISFRGCRFDYNIPPAQAIMYEGLTLLRFTGLEFSAEVYADSLGFLDATLMNNVFINNDYSVKDDIALFRSLIDFNSVGKLQMENNCFNNSPVSPSNVSSIVIVNENAKVASFNNFVDALQTDLDCPFVIEVNPDYVKFQCLDDIKFDASTCHSLHSQSPVPASGPTQTVVPVASGAPLIPSVPTLTPLPAPVVSTSSYPVTPSMVPIITTTDPTIVPVSIPTTPSPIVPPPDLGDAPFVPSVPTSAPLPTPVAPTMVPEVPEPTESPNYAPTPVTVPAPIVLTSTPVTPIMIPVITSAGPTLYDCYTNLEMIALTERDLFEMQLSIQRTYILCPNTTFIPGEALPPPATGFANDSYPLIVRSNAVVKCGEDGLSSNNCIISGSANGALGIVAAPWAMGFDETYLEGIRFEGITVDSFQAYLDDPYPVFLQMTSGDITFVDCVFSNHSGEPIFMIEQIFMNTDILRSLGQQGNRKLQSGNATFTFDSCRFESNSLPEEPIGLHGIYFLSFIGYDVDENITEREGTFNAILNNNIFLNNDLLFEGDTFARAQIFFGSTGELRMENNRFINSPVSPSSNYSSIVVVHENATVTSINNFVDDVQTDLDCPFVLAINLNDATFQCRSDIKFDATTSPVEIGTTVPVSLAPLSPVPASSAPVSPAPVSPAPVSSAPVSPVPISSAPVAPGPASSAPVSPVPISSAPVSPVSVSLAPVSPVPSTSVPVTASPTTDPVPDTSVPSNLMAGSSAPGLSESGSPVLGSSAPDTSAPVSSVPGSLAPVTAVPTTSAPAAPLPVAALPEVPSNEEPVNEPSLEENEDEDDVEEDQQGDDDEDDEEDQQGDDDDDEEDQQGEEHDEGEEDQEEDEQGEDEDEDQKDDEEEEEQQDGGDEDQEEDTDDNGKEGKDKGKKGKEGNGKDDKDKEGKGRKGDTKRGKRSKR